MQSYDRLNKTQPKPVSAAESKAGAVFGLTIALCAAALLVMGTIKIGLIWFT